MRLTCNLALMLGLCGAMPMLAAPPESAEDGWILSADIRLRSEYLANSFRLLAPTHDHLQFSRSQIRLRYQTSDWGLEFEIQDSRAWGARGLSPLATDDVNSLEPVNAKIVKKWSLGQSAALAMTAGRMTLDYGSRRLLARNNFRNTSNAFQGLHFSYYAAAGTANVFYTLPLQRQPDVLDSRALGANSFSLDKAGRGERFWGASYDYEITNPELRVSAYLFASETADKGSRRVADRQLRTFGSRLAWQGTAVDIEAEAAYQWGDSVAGVLAPADDALHHRAWFTHLHLGVDFKPALNLRFAFDQATGDRDPFDDRNERFDRLYGARAFELGPSGIFGAAIRSNIRSAQLRLHWRSTVQQSWLLSHRWLSLDSPRDFFVTAGRRDASGRSGRDIGRQWELRWAYKPANSVFSMELGAAYLDKGAYFKGAGESILNPPDTEDTEYAFAQLTWRY